MHILQSCNQGSSTVILLLEHVLRTLQTDNPEIQYAYFQQDNAGCYHSATTIVAIPAIQLSSGVSVLAVEFSDPQGGKGPANHMLATCKNHIGWYFNQGHDVTTVEQMKEAILSHGGVEGVVVVDVAIQEMSEKRKITGINKLNNFGYREGVLGRRAYRIGTGSLITISGENAGESTLKALWLN